MKQSHVLNSDIFIAPKHWQILQYHLTNTFHVSLSLFFLQEKKNRLEPQDQRSGSREQAKRRYSLLRPDPWRP